MAELSGKHAVVTGGGSGVGASIAQALAEAGATVTVSGRRRDVLDDVAKTSDRISAMTCDVTDPDSVASLFSSVCAAHGGVDIVIANAGAAESVPFSKQDIDGWRKAIDVNLTGAFLTMQAGLSAMAGKDWGRIITIASVAGLRGYPYVAAYCAAKHGVVGLTKSVAMEVAKTGITVNAVCPGYTQTPMLERTLDNIMEKTGMSREDAAKALLRQNPTGQFVQPEEVAQTVQWLCGPNSASITGQALSVSGGEV
ncbi:SDR family NAD(P)-dependent oxidoreductase [Hoeflea sp. TYP-13]|uniref:SDR family NAD(P)-dependent oxidoreductase n=1 Tax=Hoeflea sp. TYP-13 TaxID=3230023 RepID=UPI0034C6BE02